MLDVISYGILCLDYIWRMPRLPEPGGGVGIEEEAVMIGGEAANTFFPLLRWGVKAALVGNALGDDDRSVQLRRLLDRSDAPPGSLFVPRLPEVTAPFCACLATPDGHRTMIGKGFGERKLAPLDPRLAESARFFAIDSTGYMKEGKEAAALAARFGAKVMAMDCEEVPDICDMSDTVQASSESLPFRDADDEEAKLVAWAKEKRDRHVTNVLVTRGPKGCIVAASEGGCFSVPAYPVERVTDSTGCGDVFRAGYLYGRTRGWDLLKAVQFGAAAASFNCDAMGGFGGIASVDAILARMIEFDFAARAV